MRRRINNMRRRTIKEFYRDASNPEVRVSPEDYKIYLVRPDDTVALYIGQSGNPASRMLDHLGIGTWGESSLSLLGQCIHAHLPASGEWYFEEYTLEDCREITTAYRKDLDIYRQLPHLLDNPFWPDQTEEAMIKHYRPCLNVACNPDPLPLPAHLEWRKPNDTLGSKLESLYGI
jgi:hypothetical protein